jgi:hypothetical protein
MSTPQQPDWLQQAKALLDESARDIDGASLSRLNRARQAALAQRRVRTWQPAWIGATAGACALLIAVGIWHAPQVAETPTLAVNPIADEFDLVASDDNMELAQNLDFYTWLEVQDDDAEG